MAQTILPRLYRSVSGHECSPDQLATLHHLVAGTESIFLTGPAGTGKSHVLKKAIAMLRKRLGRDRRSRLAVTGMTGMAALLLPTGGTLHSYLDTGIDPEIAMAKALMKMGTEGQRYWRRAMILMVDEVSQCHGRFFDHMDRVLRQVRGRQHLAFGGLRLILTGDMLQLPPIAPRALERDVGEDLAVQFIFETQAWRLLKPMVLRLTEPHRHPDPAFVDLLSRARRGALTRDDMARLQTRVLPIPMGPHVTHFFPTNAEVDRHNAMRLDAIDKKALPRLYRAEDMVLDPWPAKDVARWQREGKTPLPTPGEAGLEALQAPPLLTLKRSAHVIHLINTEELANGDRGIVTRMDADEVHVAVPRLGRVFVIQPHLFEIKDKFQRVLASRLQLPLRLAWALTFHKSQGQTVHGPLVLNLSAESCKKKPGMAYMALSRIHGLDQLYLTGVDAAAFHVHPRALAWEDAHEAMAGTAKRSRDESDALRVDAGAEDAERPTKRMRRSQ